MPIKRLRVEFEKLHQDVELPSYQTAHASGMDVRAFLKEPVVLLPGERKLIPTGFKMAVPPGFEAQVRPRSGLALKHGITITNSPGTIDSDYRGEVGVIFCNSGQEPFSVEPGMRIAQIVIQEVFRADCCPVESLSDTERKGGGFGSTGSK